MFSRHFRICAVLLLIGVSATGCKDPNAKQVVDHNPKESIIGKETQDIQEFDPNDQDVEVSDGKMKTPHPLNPMGALAAYGPTLEKISGMGIDMQVRLFHAEHGRYPKDHAEFMEQIIKKNQIKLPVLPGGAEYRYDVEKHELVVVKPKKKDS